MSKTLIFTLTILSANCTFAMSDNEIMNLVPKGTIIHRENDEIKIRTQNGSIVEIEINLDGSLDEASGSSIKNDTFMAPKGYLSLTQIANKLKAKGKYIKGEWSYEHSYFRGWHYEVHEYINGHEMEYKVDAKSGKIITSKIDD